MEKNNEEKKEWVAPEIRERELTKWHWLVFHEKKLQIGKNTDIGAFTLLEASQGIIIEDEVQIASHCSLYSKTTINNKKGKIVLKKNSHIGTHSVIMPGVTIGENSIVGAMSFVNRDIPDNEVWVGSPARFMKKIETIEKKEVNSERKIPLFKTYWTENDVKATEKVIRRGTHWAAGPEIQEFEKKLAEFTERKYALTFNSGTSALVALYSAVGINGREVIVPSFTFIATVNAVILAGGRPVFAESEEETLGLDAEDVARKITADTKAIVALNYAGGVSRDIEKLKLLAEEKGIVLLEDNAHSLGVRKNGKMCGTFSLGAALSFCQNKLITTGEGGAAITDSQKLYEKMKLFRSHGRVESSDGDYFSSTEEQDYLEVGHNFRMPTINAALGISQLENFAETMRLRKESGDYLSQELAKIEGIKNPKTLENSDHFYQMYTIMLPSKEIRNDLQKYLNKNGIMCKVYYYPIHLKSFYRNKYNYTEGYLPKTEAISEQVLTLPMYPGMSKEEINFIVINIKKFFQETR